MKFIKYLTIPILLLPLIIQKLSYLLIFDVINSFLVYILLTILIVNIFLISNSFVNSRNKLFQTLLIFCLIINSSLLWKVNSFYSKFEINDNVGETVKFLSVNVWWQNGKYEEMLSFIKNQNADIIGIIEFTTPQYEYFQEYLISNYKYSNIDSTSFDKPYAGNIIFSKYPITKSDEYLINGYYSGFTKSDIELNNKTYGFYLVHTSAPINEEYFKYRNDQLTEIANKVNDSETDSIVIAGDFNLSPWSYYYEDFISKFANKVNNISGASDKNITWEHHDYPFVMSHIDHVFVSENIKISDVKIEDFPNSDHKAIISEISI